MKRLVLFAGCLAACVIGGQARPAEAAGVVDVANAAADLAGDVADRDGAADALPRLREYRETLADLDGAPADADVGATGLREINKALDKAVVRLEGESRRLSSVKGCGAFRD
jgi:hypothetical protein